MTRYWQHTNGTVYPYRDEWQFERPQEWTEVKVAPLDAIVIEPRDVEYAPLWKLYDVATHPDVVEGLLNQAVLIGQAGGIDVRTLEVLLHLAATRVMTPSSRAALREVGINPDPTDAIVIDRADLPKVREASSLGVGIEAAPLFNGVQYGPPHYARRDPNPDAVWANGLALLALAQYLREHPPVDEAQVEAIADALRRADRLGPDTLDAGDPETLARHLYLDGVRVEVPGEH